MKICEIFFSIQGESSFAGLPCIFIRLADCNLRCSYCDTPQSYENGEEYTLEEVMEEIGRFDCKLVEVTGGEPLLQKEVIELMDTLNSAGYKILLETNGSQSVENVPSFVRIIIDVKLPGSGHPDSFLTANLQWLKDGWDEIKFVITDRLDFDTALAFIENNNLNPNYYLFSPVTDKLKPVVLAEWIKETGLPLRLNLQLHKIIDIH